MTTLVDRLQQDALNSKGSVTNLLRQVKLIAAKLNLGKVEDWVESELNGYGGKPVPPYRIIRGQPKAHNPFNGWIPIMSDDTNMIEKLSIRDATQRISEIEDLLTDSKADILQMPFAPGVIAALNRGARVPFGEMALIVNRASLVGIIDSVRNKILDWALELEKSGIKGSETSFTAEEQTKARDPSITVHIGSIGSFVGNLGAGSVTGDVTSTIKIETIEALARQLRQHQSELAKTQIDQERFELALSRLEDSIKKKNTRQGLKSILTDIRQILTGAAGNLVAAGAIQLINQMLGTGVPPP